MHPWERSEAQAHTDKRSLNGGVRCGGGGGGRRASDWASGWGPQHLHFTVTVLCDGVPPAAACARHWAVSEGVPGAPPSERAMRTFVPFHCEGALYGGVPRGGRGGHWTWRRGAAALLWASSCVTLCDRPAPMVL